MTSPSVHPDQFLTEQEAQLLAAFEKLSDEDQLAMKQIAEQIAGQQETHHEPMTRDDIEALFASLRKQG